MTQLYDDQTETHKETSQVLGESDSDEELLFFKKDRYPAPEPGEESEGDGRGGVERDDAVPAHITRRRVTTTAAERGPSVLRPRLLFVACFMLAIWLAYSTHAHRVRKKSRSNIIYASRYSKEHKYRPAASPIITETLKDGRTRLRGATPPPPPIPTPTAMTKRRRTGRGSRRKGSKTKTKLRH